MSDRGYAFIKIGGVILEDDVPGLCHAIALGAPYLSYDGSDGLDFEGVDREMFDSGTFAPKTAQHLIRAVEGIEANHSEVLILSDPEACEGVFSSIENFCKEHKIDFDRHSDQLFCYQAEWLYFRKETEEETVISDNDCNHYVDEVDVKRAIEQLEKNDHKKALEILKGHVSNIQPLAPLRIKMRDGSILSPKMPPVEAGGKDDSE